VEKGEGAAKSWRDPRRTLAIAHLRSVHHRKYSGI